MPWLLFAVLAILAAIFVWAWLVNDDESAGPERGVAVEDIAETDASRR